MNMRIDIFIIWLAVFKVGDVVLLSPSEDIVRDSFDEIDYIWDDLMIDMLGNPYFVLEVLEGGDIIAIESPDGSQDGKWYFSSTVFKLVS